MGKPTDSRKAWQELRKCRILTPAEADALFFPGPGSKVKKAEKFCTPCPVRNKCLEEALKLKLNGFWAGTTDQERILMMDFVATLPVDVLDFLPRSVQEREKGVNVGRRPVQPKKDANPLCDPLFGVEGPTDEELRLLA